MGILHMAQRASDLVNRAAIIFCVGCVLAMLAISFIGFLYTVFTGGALSWTYSLARLFLPWIGLISVTIALRSGEHVAMTSLVRLLPPALVRVAVILCLASLAFFAGLMIWYGWEFYQGATQIYMVSDQIQISHKATAAAVPLTGLIILLHLSHGSSLLEHYTGEEAMIQEALHNDDLRAAEEARLAERRRQAEAHHGAPAGRSAGGQPAGHQPAGHQPAGEKR